MATNHFETLRGAVLAASSAGTWAQAVQEWQMVSVEEDPDHNGICMCGKTELFYLYKIHNHVTQQDLFPIGSKCVNLFEVEELDLSVSVLQKLLKLRSAFASHQNVDLTSEFFSRDVLADLWQNDAFPSNQFNRGNGDNDYKFLLDLFNQHHEFTHAEKRKVWVLINRTIKPFVMNDERLG